MAFGLIVATNSYVLDNLNTSSNTFAHTPKATEN